MGTGYLHAMPLPSTSASVASDTIFNSSAIIQISSVEMEKPTELGIPTWRKEIIMSEKQQHTTASMREKMLSRYGDSLHHKHNKFHHSYRLHCRLSTAELIDPPVRQTN